jgi:CheY-like chemotaxis protein
VGTLDDARHVVLVCDNRGYRRDFLAEALRGYGCSVTPLATAQEAKYYISRHGYPDLLLTDGTTASYCRNDGWRLAEELRAAGRAAIVMTKEPHIDFPEVAYIRSSGTAVEVATEALSVFEES